jgi:hypothetical protein
LHIFNIMKIRRISSSEKEKNKLMMTINVCSLKTRVVWIMMVIEEGSTRAWTRWTIHQWRASGKLGVDVPYVMEKRQVDIWVWDINHAM